MRDRLLIGASLQGVVGGLVEIVHGSSGVAPTDEMHRQLRGNLRRLGRIPAFLAEPDLLMQLYPAAGRHARVRHLLIETVRELVARRRRPVGPRLDAVGPNKPPLARQRAIARFDPVGGRPRLAPRLQPR